jgi:hypothetical protein
MNLAFGCCVGSWNKVCRYVAPALYGRPLVALSGQSSIAEAYNTILDVCRDQPVDGLVLLHDDLEITDPHFDTKVRAAVSDRDVALVGVAGGRGVSSLAWWNAETVGHQRIDSGLIDFGARAGEVDLLEGSMLVFTRWSIDNLRFDVRFEGFHGYDEIAMQARVAGRKVTVADIDTHHHTTLGFSTPESARAWRRADAQFREKWNL